MLNYVWPSIPSSTYWSMYTKAVTRQTLHDARTRLMRSLIIKMPDTAVAMKQLGVSHSWYVSSCSTMCCPLGKWPAGIFHCGHCQKSSFSRPSKDHLDRILWFMSDSQLYQDTVLCWCSRVITTNQGTAVLVLNKLRLLVESISPQQGKCFNLRLLVHNFKGPQTFAYLKTVNDELRSSFHVAFLKLGLLEDDNQYHLAMEEAIVSNSPESIHMLFAVVWTIQPTGYLQQPQRKPWSKIFFISNVPTQGWAHGG